MLFSLLYLTFKYSFTKNEIFRNSIHQNLAKNIDIIDNHLT